MKLNLILDDSEEYKLTFDEEIALREFVLSDDEDDLIERIRDILLTNQVHRYMTYYQSKNMS